MEESTIKPAPPGLPGLIWRPISRHDLAALVELATACYRTDGGIAFLNEPENLKRRYFRDAPGVAIGAFTTDGRLIACATVHVMPGAGAGRGSLVGQVRPEWRKRGIGTYLIHWSLAQARVLFAAILHSGPLLQITTETLTNRADRLYRAYGFEPVDVQLVMRRDLHLPLPEHSLLPGVTLANWQAELVEQFYQAYYASFRERPGFPGWSAEEWISWTDDDNLRPEWSLLARRREVPLGFVTAGVEHVDAFIMQIGVVPGERRRGLGSALLVEAMRRMRAAGESATELTVNLNNPGAIEAYVRLGFATVGRRARYERIAER